MPSTLVHVGVAGLVAAALLGDSFDAEAVAVALVATALVDLDAFVGLVVPGTHRAAFHTLLLPAVASAGVYYDARVRGSSRLARWRPDAARVLGVALVAVVVAGIGLDLATNGVNALYPLHDQFYTLDGQLRLSDQRGLVQTFVEPADGGTRTTGNTHYSTGVDPTRGAEPADVERVFPVVSSGRELLLTLAGFGAVAFRLWETRR